MKKYFLISVLVVIMLGCGGGTSTDVKEKEDVIVTGDTVKDVGKDQVGTDTTTVKDTVGGEDTAQPKDTYVKDTAGEDIPGVDIGTVDVAQQKCTSLTWPGEATKVFNLQIATGSPYSSPYGTSYNNKLATGASFKTALTLLNPVLQAQFDNPIPTSSDQLNPIIVIGELRFAESENPATPTLKKAFQTVFYIGDLPAKDPATCSHPNEPATADQICNYEVDINSYNVDGEFCIPKIDFKNAFIDEKTNILSDPERQDKVFFAGDEDSKFEITIPLSFSTGVDCNANPEQCLVIIINAAKVEALYSYDFGVTLGDLTGTGVSEKPQGIISGVICKKQFALLLENLYKSPSVTQYKPILKTLKCEFSCDCLTTGDPALCTELACPADCESKENLGDVEGVCPGDEVGKPDGLSAVILFHTGPGNIKGLKP